MKTSIWIACVALLGFQQLGSATNLGVLNATPDVQILEILAPDVTFSTQYHFTVLEDAAVSAGASNLWLQLNNITVLGIEDFSLTLHDASQQLLTSAVANSNSYTIDAYALAPNPYYFQVSGNTVGSSGGYYSFAAAAYKLLTPVSVVPESSALAMTLLGLTLIGLYRHRLTGSTVEGATA